MKAEFIQLLRGVITSKTINSNTIIAGAIVIVATHYGFGDLVTPEQAAVITGSLMAIINIGLRFLTKKSIPEKGLDFSNPLYRVINDEKALEELYDKLVLVARARKK